MRFDRISTPLVTPCHADLALNADALAETVEMLIAAGVHGIIGAGTTGDYDAQSPEERVDPMRRVRALGAGRVPVIVGIGAMRTEESIAHAEAAREAGADALLIATPPYAVPTGREIALHALVVDRAANLPVMLCNHPGRTGVNMDAAYLDRLGRSPRLCAIEESSGVPHRLHMRARDYPRIRLGCGMDDEAPEFFAQGGAVPGLRRLQLRARGAPRCGVPARWRAISRRGARSCPRCCR